MLNPDKKYIHSEGVDLPIMHVYLAGRIAGTCIDRCLEWRYAIINHYKNYKGKGVYPIAFLDALNSKEADSIDKLGLTSMIPPNLIYDKDLLSVERADVVVANLNDFMEVGIEKQLNLTLNDFKNMDLNTIWQHYKNLINCINNRRPNYGTISEVAWALYLKKPLILIADSRVRKQMLDKHPFMKRASVIVENVDELLEKKWLNILYKSISGAVY